MRIVYYNAIALTKMFWLYFSGDQTSLNTENISYNQFFISFFHKVLVRKMNNGEDRCCFIQYFIKVLKYICARKCRKFCYVYT